MRRARKRTTRRKPVMTRRVRKGAKAWTPEQTALLKSAYKTRTTTEIAKMLRRTVSSVKAKARTLGLRKRARRVAAAKRTTTRRRTTVRRTATRRKTVRKTTVRKKATRRKTTRRKTTRKPVARRKTTRRTRRK